MAQAREEIIANQSQFYRNGFRKIVTMVFVLMVIAYGLLGLIIYQHLTRPTPQYFVTTSSGRLVEIQPIESPAPIAAPARVEPAAP